VWSNQQKGGAKKPPSSRGICWGGVGSQKSRTGVFRKSGGVGVRNERKVPIVEQFNRTLGGGKLWKKSNKRGQENLKKKNSQGWRGRGGSEKKATPRTPKKIEIKSAQLGAKKKLRGQRFPAEKAKKPEARLRGGDMVKPSPFGGGGKYHKRSQKQKQKIEVKIEDGYFVDYQGALLDLALGRLKGETAESSSQSNKNRQKRNSRSVGRRNPN